MSVKFSRRFWGDVMIMAYQDQTKTLATNGERKLAHKGFEPASWQFKGGWDR